MILDTNALSAAAEGEPGAIRMLARAGPVALPVIVLGKYRFGIAESRHQQQYERWLEEVISRSRVLDINQETASWYAHLRVQLQRSGNPIPTDDLWIAALCLQHALPLFLSRVRHFDFVKGLPRLDC